MISPKSPIDDEGPELTFKVGVFEDGKCLDPFPSRRIVDGIEIEIGDGGSIRLFCSRASDQFKETRVIFEVIVGGLVRRVVDLAAVVSSDSGFAGDWEIGEALTKLQGAVSHFRLDNWWVDAADCQPYPEFGYERIWRGPTDELGTPDPIVARLVGPLNRALNDGKCPMPGPA